MLNIIKAEFEHIPDFAKITRQADINEFYAASRSTPTEAMRDGLRVSSFAWSAFINNEPVAMFGVAPLSTLSGVGVPWLVSTRNIDKYKKEFLRPCKRYVDLMLSVFPELENYVAADNVRAISWLKYLGFSFDEAIPYGIYQQPFNRFYLGVDHV